MQRNEYMEEISNKIRSGEPVGFLDAIAAINYQATLKAEREAAEAATLRGRIKRWLKRKTGWLRAS